MGDREMNEVKKDLVEEREKNRRLEKRLETRKRPADQMQACNGTSSHDWQDLLDLEAYLTKQIKRDDPGFEENKENDPFYFNQNEQGFDPIDHQIRDSFMRDND